MVFVPKSQCVQCGASKGEAGPCVAVDRDGAAVLGRWDAHRWLSWTVGMLLGRGVKVGVAEKYRRLLFRDFDLVPCEDRQAGHSWRGPVCDVCGTIDADRAKRTIALLHPGVGGPAEKAIICDIDDAGWATLAVPVSKTQLRVLDQPVAFAVEPIPGRWTFDPEDVMAVR